MSQFNFLPDSIIKQRETREVRHWLLAGALCIAVVIAIGVFAIIVRSNRISNNTEAQAKLLNESKRIHLEVTSIQSKIGVMRDANKQIANLSEKLPTQAVISFLVQQMPNQIALTQLTWQTPKLPKTTTNKKAAPTRKAVKVVAKPSPKCTLILNGIANSDIDTARYVSQLSNSTLFESVKLVNSREIEINGKKLFEFHISAEISTNRDVMIAGTTE